jgi:hypothetical protein
MSLSIASGNVTETQDEDFVEWSAQNFGWVIIYLSAPTIGSQ